tara:strand:- start:1857 stop:2015 length:159 start_codon:yes stop_codon:yes gene_type:complete
MNIISAEYIEDNAVRVVTDDGVLFIPVDPSNRDYILLMDWVDSDSGNSISVS